MTKAEIDAALPGFEGLVRETSRQIVAAGVELDFDDVAQLLRVKVWQALRSYDPVRAAEAFTRPHPRTPMERYVFIAVANGRKDIEKRPRRHQASVDEIRERTGAVVTNMSEQTVADWFDGRFLSVEAEEVYFEVEDELQLPPTLTRLERRLIRLKMDGLLLLEIDRTLGLSRAQRERVLESVRVKLADRRPPRSAPMQPLPGVEPRSARRLAA